VPARYGRLGHIRAAAAPWLIGSADPLRLPGNLQRAEICARQFGEATELLPLLDKTNAVKKVDLGLIPFERSERPLRTEPSARHYLRALRSDGVFLTELPPSRSRSL
jgi:hypothetical protein